jgi:predicted nucleic acid-binding protein
MALCQRIGGAAELHAPHLIDIEFLNVLRRLVHGQALSIDAAAVAREQFEDLTIERYPHEPLRDRIWQLRDSLTAYDGAFVALGETLGLPLVTSDGRLARSHGHRAQVESYAR